MEAEVDGTAPPPETKKQEKSQDVPTPDRRKPTIQAVERLKEPVHVHASDKNREVQWRARRIKLDKKRKEYQVVKLKRKSKEGKVLPPQDNNISVKQVAVAGAVAAIAGTAMYMFNKS